MQRGENVILTFYYPEGYRLPLKRNKHRRSCLDQKLKTNLMYPNPGETATDFLTRYLSQSYLSIDHDTLFAHNAPLFSWNTMMMEFRIMNMINDRLHVRYQGLFEKSNFFEDLLIPQKAEDISARIIQGKSIPKQKKHYIIGQQ